MCALLKHPPGANNERQNMAIGLFHKMEGDSLCMFVFLASRLPSCEMRQEISRKMRGELYNWQWGGIVGNSPYTGT